MEFKKWNSIENHYNRKAFKKFADINPEINNETFEVTEKIHGANFSIIGDGLGGVFFAKRTSILNEDEKFYGFQEVFKRDKYDFVVSFIREFAKKLNKEVQLYGELYGSNIQKGVFYGAEKNFRWYSLRIDGIIVPPKDAEVLLKSIIHIKVPVIGLVNANGDFLEMIDSINQRFQSKLTPKEYEDENICEGVVIVPYEKLFYNQKALLLIKKKNEEFKDKSKVKKTRIVKEIPENIQKLIDEGVSYINENRTNDLFSKMGELEDIHDISKYAKEYFSDVFIDFEKDNYTEWNKLNDSEKGVIKKKMGPAIYKELKESLLR
jgi:Rnl2 family RNA ligase